MIPGSGAALLFPEELRGQVVQALPPDLPLVAAVGLKPDVRNAGLLQGEVGIAGPGVARVLAAAADPDERHPGQERRRALRLGRARSAAQGADRPEEVRVAQADP